MSRSLEKAVVDFIFMQLQTYGLQLCWGINSLPVSFQEFCFNFCFEVYLFMAASKSSLLLLNFVIDLTSSLLSLGRYSTGSYSQQVIQCNETLLLNCFLIIARVSLSSTKVLFQFQIQ